MFLSPGSSSVLSFCLEVDLGRCTWLADNMCPGRGPRVLDINVYTLFFDAAEEQEHAALVYFILVFSVARAAQRR